MRDDKTKITRRRLLGTAGVVTGGVVAGGLAAIPLSRPGEMGKDYPRVEENHALLPPNGKSVLIVGGGLAGLQAGVELSARGFAVTILEKTGSPGGKLKAWRDREFGPADDHYKADPSFPGYIREHGIHAVWGFYNNLREFLGRYGWPLMETPKDVSIYTFRDRDGTVSHIPNASWVAPYDKLQLMLSSMNIQHVHEDDQADLVRLFRKLASFDYADDEQRAYLDSMTMEEYCKRFGVSDRLTYTICDSLIEMAYFDNVDRSSALTLANLITLVAGSPDDMRVNLYRNSVNDTFLRPMVSFIESRGGKIHFRTEVSELLVEDGRVTGAVAAAVPQQAVRRCSICGALIFDGVEVGGECPFCGAREDMIRPVQDVEREDRRFSADYVVCALDGPGVKHLVSNNLDVLGDQPYFQNILKLNATSVYVCNLWFEGKNYWEPVVQDEKGRPAICFFPTGFDHLGITINRALRVTGGDGTHLAWSSEYVDRNVTVIETQIAKADAVNGTQTSEIADLCYQELKEVMPNLPPPVDYYVNRWHNYTAYYVGDEGNRPTVQSPIDNLLFIGDISFVPHPAVFMEKTNVTAKWATNLLLEKAGQQAGHIRILPSGTSSVLIDGLKKVSSVFI